LSFMTIKAFLRLLSLLSLLPRGDYLLFRSNNRRNLLSRGDKSDITARRVRGGSSSFLALQPYLAPTRKSRIFRPRSVMGSVKDALSVFVSIARCRFTVYCRLEVRRWTPAKHCRKRSLGADWPRDSSEIQRRKGYLGASFVARPVLAAPELRETRYRPPAVRPQRLPSSLARVLASASEEIA